MSVYCWNDDCKHNENGCCKSDHIEIGEDLNCETFSDYHEEAEWKTPFWKRFTDIETDKIARVKYYGKEIECYGRKFFVESKSGYATVTDNKTGLSCGELLRLDKTRVEVINERESSFPALETLPIAFRDPKTGKLIFDHDEKEGADHEQEDRSI